MRRAWILIALLLVPVIEIAVVVRVGGAIGAPMTIGLLLALTLLGAWVVKREGARAWRALREASSTGVLPATELTDAALVLVGGTLLLTPGFVTDVLGLFFVLPFTRPLARRLVQTLIGRRVAQFDRSIRPSSYPPRPNQPGPNQQGPQVVRGEVIED